MDKNENEFEADIQGIFLGMPYDFRRPSKTNVLSRIWNKNAPLFPPKSWGIGWTVNLKHPKAPLFFFMTAMIGSVAVLAALSNQ
ncbi:MAG: hypothetical protein VYC39_13665 [Myxococcota bacterium]|nr:hypothetical protein [Myxococcota bacterium]